jgi:hypothetical protein
MITDLDPSRGSDYVRAMYRKARMSFRRGTGAGRRFLVARVPGELHAELHRIRSRDRVSMSELVREAVEALLAARGRRAVGSEHERCST